MTMTNHNIPENEKKIEWFDRKIEKKDDKLKRLLSLLISRGLLSNSGNKSGTVSANRTVDTSSHL